MAASSPAIVILDGARTPMAEYNGAFSDVSAIDLGVVASAEGPSSLAATGAGRDRPRHLRQRAADLGRRHLRRAPRRAQGRRPEGGPGADRQPALRLGLRVDRPGRPSHPARRSEDGSGGRDGEHVAGAARDPRRAQGTAARPGTARGLPDGGAARLLLRPLHGPDVGPRRGQVRDLARRAGRVRPVLPAARGRGMGGLPALRGGRPGRGQGGPQDDPRRDATTTCAPTRRSRGSRPFRRRSERTARSPRATPPASWTERRRSS